MIDYILIASYKLMLHSLCVQFFCYINECHNVGNSLTIYFPFKFQSLLLFYKFDALKKTFDSDYCLYNFNLWENKPSLKFNFICINFFLLTTRDFRFFKFSNSIQRVIFNQLLFNCQLSRFIFYTIVNKS
jgi:hypothetical protein